MRYTSLARDPAFRETVEPLARFTPAKSALSARLDPRPNRRSILLDQPFAVTGDSGSVGERTEDFVRPAPLACWAQEHSRRNDVEK